MFSCFSVSSPFYTEISPLSYFSAFTFSSYYSYSCIPEVLSLTQRYIEIYLQFLNDCLIVDYSLSFTPPHLSTLGTCPWTIGSTSLAFPTLLIPWSPHSTIINLIIRIFLLHLLNILTLRTIHTLLTMFTILTILTLLMMLTLSTLRTLHTL